MESAPTEYSWRKQRWNQLAPTPIRHLYICGESRFDNVMNSKQIEEIRIHSVAQRRTRFAKSPADKSLVRVIGVAIFVHLLEALDCRSAHDA
jgi:hypothetical protein